MLELGTIPLSTRNFGEHLHMKSFTSIILQHGQISATHE